MIKKGIRIISLLLTIALLLAACGTDNEYNKKNDTSKVANTNTPSQFVEIDITPEGTKDLYFPKLQMFSSEEIYFTALNKELIPFAYKMNEKFEWLPITNKGANELFATSNADAQIHYLITPSGMWWATWIDLDGIPHLFKIENTGVYTEISVNHYKSIMKSTPQFSIDSFDINRNGELCISTTTNYKTVWVIINISDLSESTIQPNKNSVAILMDDKLYGVESNFAITEYNLNLNNKKAIGSIPVTEKPTNNVMNFTSNNNQALSYITSHGIFRYSIGTSIEQVITQKKSCVFSRSDYYGGSLIAPNEDSYMMACRTMLGSKIYRYLFDKEGLYLSENKENETVFSIWALNNSPMLKSAIFEFSSKNPNVKIDVQIGKDNNSSFTNEDIIRDLNTQLLTGDCPDVVILDDLPIEQYLKSGLFRNISDVINKDNFYQNIIDCYNINGKNYAYPALFKVPALFSLKSNAPLQVEALEDVVQLIAKPGASYFESYFDLFDKFYASQSAYIFPNGNTVDKEALTLFLKHTKEISDFYSLTSQNTGALGDFGTRDGSTSVGSIFGFLSGKYPTAVGVIQDLSLAWSCLSEYGDNCDISALPGKAFVPAMIMAIPEDAINFELGKRFIEYTLTSKEVLISSEGQGISVVKNANVDILNDSAASSRVGYNPANYAWNDFFGKLKQPAITSVTLKEKVLEYASKFYEQQYTLDEAVKQIIQSTNIYFEELK